MQASHISDRGLLRTLRWKTWPLLQEYKSPDNRTKYVMRNSGTGLLGTHKKIGTQLSQLLEVTTDLNMKGHVTQGGQSEGLPSSLAGMHPSTKTWAYIHGLFGALQVPVRLVCRLWVAEWQETTTTRSWSLLYCVLESLEREMRSQRWGKTEVWPKRQTDRQGGCYHLWKRILASTSAVTVNVPPWVRSSGCFLPIVALDALHFAFNFGGPWTFLHSFLVL